MTGSADDKKSADETKQMLALVGEAISEWSFVELTLCNIFTVCVTSCPTKAGPDGYVTMIDSQVPTAIFYSVENFRSKLGMVESALFARICERDAWAEDIRTEWGRLKEKVRKLSLRRNKLAHWTVTPAQYDQDISIPAKLMPPYGSPGWYSETSSQPPGNHLDPKQVDEIVRAFSQIDEKLRAFYRSLARHPQLTEKYDVLCARLVEAHRRLDPDRGARLDEKLNSARQADS